MPFDHKDGRFFAVIDIGSNSIKISVAKLTIKNYSILIEEKESLRLLEANEYEIRPGKVDHLIRILRHFADLAHGYECDIQTIATSAVRRATNKKAVCDLVQKETGLHIEIISGQQEAAYIIEATQLRFDVSKGKYWIVDIGGGSAEIGFLKNQKIIHQTSLPIGAVVIKDRYFEKPLTKFKEVNIVVEDLSARIAGVVEKKSSDQILISGGTPAAVAKIVQVLHDDFGHPLHGMTIRMDDLHEVAEKLIDNGKEDLASCYGINKNRVDLILPALCTIQAFLHFADEKKYIVSRTGLREGVICTEFLKQDRLKLASKA